MDRRTEPACLFSAERNLPNYRPQMDERNYIPGEKRLRGLRGFIRLRFFQSRQGDTMIAISA